VGSGFDDPVIPLVSLVFFLVFLVVKKKHHKEHKEEHKGHKEIIPLKFSHNYSERIQNITFVYPSCPFENLFPPSHKSIA